ncbi:MAG: hypothetical protein JWM78_854 [Verrucomicrobiaceae bacterium]|nr:hypothetical protein [Verrucomicrobiaceae bacterium]
MRKVGTIKEIWRYPVKGMAGEKLESCHLGATGLQGDRVWALRDLARQEIQSCKFRPELLLCSARSRNTNAADDHNVDVLFPDGALIGTDNTDIHARLSELTGHASTLESLRPLSDLDFYRRHKRDEHTWLSELKATFDRESGEPLPDFFEQFPAAAAEFVSLPGTFFLVTPFHIVTTATLAYLKTVNPESDWDVRRFRPNVVIDTDTSEGLVEQQWIGSQITLGDAAVDCAGTTPRCGAVTRAQREFGADKTILRTIVKQAEQNVGIYGAPKQSGKLRVGASVYVH